MKDEIMINLYKAKYPLASASMEDAKDSKRRHCILEHYGVDNIGRVGSWLYPTLSELIEACLPHFDRLVTEKNGSEKWHAIGYKNDTDPNSVIICIENSPEIAVANLWLKLHE